MSKSLSQIVSFDDGAGFLAENGDVICNTLTAKNLSLIHI